MARMLTQVPLPLLPRDAAEIAPGVGVVAGPDGGGVVWVHGLATFAWDAGDEAARRLAAVQLVQLKAATQVQVAQAFGVIPVSVWRWARALAGGGVAGLVPAVKGPQRASKLTPQVIGQIRELDRHGAGKAAIAAAAGVSESSVRSVLRPARPAAGSQDAGGADGIPAGQDPAGADSAGPDADFADTGMGADPDPEPEVLPVLPDPVPRDGERALARFGLLGEGAAPAFTPGARYPLAGLLLALPPLAGTGLLDCARQVYGRLRNGFYGLEVMLVVLVFMALLREARAEGATRIPPDALGRVLGLDRAPEVKTIRRKLGELAAAGKAADLQLALARHHAAASPGTLGFLYIDGHTRAYFGKRDIQKMHLARLKFPGPATEETWVTGSAGDPLLVVIAQPSSSLAAQIRDLLPALRDITGPGARPVLCFDRGGWSPALFADITDAGFDLLTYRKNDTGKDIPDLPGDAFSAAGWTGDDGRDAHLRTGRHHDRGDDQRGRAQRPRAGAAAGHAPQARRHPPGPHPDHPPRRRAARRRRHLPDDLPVAGGELLPLRPHPLRPRRPRHLRHHPRRPRPDGAEPGEENRGRRRQDREENPHQPPRPPARPGSPRCAAPPPAPPP